MKNQKEYFYYLAKVINVQNNTYVYDANINKIGKCPELLDADFVFSDSYLLKNKHKYNSLLSKGFFQKSKLRYIWHPQTSIISEFYNKCQSHLILQVTHDCNLRCKYCCYSSIYHNRTRKDHYMTFDMAKQSIDEFINQSIQSKVLTFSFYGGEPLLCFDLIKECVRYIEQRIHYKKIVYRITTNATVLSDEIIQFLIDKKVLLLVSIDGPESIHDRCRVFSNGQGTYQTVIHNLKKIMEYDYQYFSTINFNCVMYDKSNYFEVVDFFKNGYVDTQSEYDINSHLSISSLTAGIDSNAFLKLLGDDLYNGSEFRKRIRNYKSEKERMIQKIIGCYSTHSYVNVRIPRLYQRGIAKNLLNIESSQYNKTPCFQEAEHPSGPCIPGCNKLMVDPNGILWPCEKVDESDFNNSLGSIYTGIEFDRTVNVLNIARRKGEKCVNCWAFRFCGQCVANCDEQYGACERSVNSFESVLYTYILTEVLRREIITNKYENAIRRIEDMEKI